MYNFVTWSKKIRQLTAKVLKLPFVSVQHGSAYILNVECATFNIDSEPFLTETKGNFRTVGVNDLFGPSNKVVYLKKLVSQNAVRFLILFVLTDAILLILDLQKRTNDLDNPPNGKLLV